MSLERYKEEQYRREKARVKAFEKEKRKEKRGGESSSETDSEEGSFEEGKRASMAAEFGLAGGMTADAAQKMLGAGLTAADMMDDDFDAKVGRVLYRGDGRSVSGDDDFDAGLYRGEGRWLRIWEGGKMISVPQFFTFVANYVVWEWGWGVRLVVRMLCGHLCQRRAKLKPGSPCQWGRSSRRSPMAAPCAGRAVARGLHSNNEIH